MLTEWRPDVTSTNLPRLQAEQHAKVQAQRLSMLCAVHTTFVEKSSSCASAAAAAAAAAAAVGAPFSPATALVPVEGAAPLPASGRGLMLGSCTTLPPNI